MRRARRKADEDTAGRQACQEATFTELAAQTAQQGPSPQPGSPQQGTQSGTQRSGAPWYLRPPQGSNQGSCTTTALVWAGSREQARGRAPRRPAGPLSSNVKLRKLVCAAGRKQGNWWMANARTALHLEAGYLVALLLWSGELYMQAAELETSGSSCSGCPAAAGKNK